METSVMPESLRAVVREGKIELLEPLMLPEGAEVLVMPVDAPEADFWAQAAKTALDAVWSHDEDNVYAQLLEE
jgi:hypothetical protein